MGGQRYPMPESHPDGKKVLQRLSQETGGHFFEVTKKESVEAIYKQVQEELRNQYSLGLARSELRRAPAITRSCWQRSPKTWLYRRGRDITKRGSASTLPANFRWSAGSKRVLLPGGLHPARSLT